MTDLKDRKTAVKKGSNVYFLLVQVLENAGLAPSNIQPVYPALADVRAANEGGTVDVLAA